MTNIKIKINNTSAEKVSQDGKLTTGMVGATVDFEFGSEWDRFKKAAVFRGGGVTKSVFDIGNTVRIPVEVLQTEGYIYIGVEGYNDEDVLVYPTMWASGVWVYSGANASGDPAADPTLPIWAQLEAVIGDLSALDTEAKNSLVAAINELAAKSGSTVDEADITELVEQYLADNPITDADVGAIPAPATAQVGQTIRVKAVDEDGKPMEWEWVNVAAVGEVESWDYEQTIVAEEEVAEIVIDTFDDGTPLSLKKIELVAIVGSTESSIRTFMVYPDLHNSHNNACIVATTGNTSVVSSKTTFCRIEGDIVDGVVNYKAGTSNSARYVQYYNPPITMIGGNVGLSFDKDNSPYPNKATCFYRYKISVSAGSLTVGSTIVVKGVRA